MTHYDPKTEEISSASRGDSILRGDVQPDATDNEEEQGTNVEGNEKEEGGENKWTLLTGTPASCASIGIHFLFPDGKPDLVISGPNFGRNTYCYHPRHIEY